MREKRLRVDVRKALEVTAMSTGGAAAEVIVMMASKDMMEVERNVGENEKKSEMQLPEIMFCICLSLVGDFDVQPASGRALGFSYSFRSGL